MVPLRIWVKNMESKKDIRKRVLEKRSIISKKEWEEKSHRIYQKVVTHPFFLDADAIYCYVDYRNEVGTKNILDAAWSMRKKVAVPKVEGDSMTFYYIDSYLDLQDGYRGIPEPKAERPAQDKNVLVVMPGAAFDKNHNRIGYGKGYYDKYVQLHPEFRTIAIAFELQIIENIPADDYDICPEIIITEDTIYE